MNTSINHSKVVPELVKQAVRHWDDGAELVLFGSRARGDWTEESDWDFLILLERENSEALKREIRDRLFEIELETDEVISSLIENKKDWAKHSVTPLFQNIEREGVTV